MYVGGIEACMSEPVEWRALHSAANRLVKCSVDLEVGGNVQMGSSLR